MKWESLQAACALPAADLKAQYRAGTRVEQYRLSADALFLPREQYIPLDAIEKIQVRKGMMHSGHCCGMGFPVSNLIVFYGGERPAKLMLEKQKNAERLAALLLAARSSIVRETYIPPYEQEQPAAQTTAPVRPSELQNG